MAYEALLAAIEEGRIARKIPSERKLCMIAKVGEKTVYHIKSGHAPKPESLRRLARALGYQPSYLFDLAAAGKPDDEEPKLSPLLVKGAVQAGLWREAMEWPSDEWFAVTVPTDPRYPGIERLGLVVRGNSMDRLYPDGTIVVVIRFADLARTPEPGQRVVVLRRDRRSGEFEATLKEYAIDERGRHILWPRSTDPEFQAPFILSGQEPLRLGDEKLPAKASAGAPLHDVGEPDVQIYALVVGSYRPE